jgi:hypothetical protein
MGIVRIDLYFPYSEYEQYCKAQRIGKSVGKVIREEMSDMFPYTFLVYIKSV